MTEAQEEKELRRLTLRAAIRKYIGAGADCSRWLSKVRDNMRHCTDADFYSTLDGLVTEGQVFLKKGRYDGDRVVLVCETHTKEKEQGNGQ
jgi:hypothetical protein